MAGVYEGCAELGAARTGAVQRASEEVYREHSLTRMDSAWFNYWFALKVPLLVGTTNAS